MATLPTPKPRRGTLANASSDPLADMPSLPDTPSGSIVEEPEAEDSTPGQGSGTVQQSKDYRPAPPPKPPAGQRYVPVKKFDHVGMSEIYVVRDKRLTREIVAKVMTPRSAKDRVARWRFTREVEATTTLQHPGIVSVYDCGLCVDGRPFYMMQFIEGETFDVQIREFHAADLSGQSPTQRSLAFRELINRMIDVCDAVAYMHSENFLHRDIKPSNVMVGSYGETTLIDLGLAKKIGTKEELSANPDSPDVADGTVAGTILGTPEFMSPEQAAGQAESLTPASDIWSLGVMLYRIATGKAPIIPQTNWRNTVAEVIKAEFPRPREALSSTPPELEAIILKAMQKQPQDRYASVAEMADDLRRFLADEPVSVLKPPLRDRVRRWAKRHRSLVAGLAMLLISSAVLLTLGLILVNQEKNAKELARQDAVKQESLAISQREVAVAERQRARKSMDAVLATFMESGTLERQTDLLPEQKDLLEMVLADYRGFTQESQDDAESAAWVATALYRVGFIQMKLGHREEAEAAYRRSIELWEARVQAEPESVVSRRGLARSLHYLGFLKHDLGKDAESEKLYQRVLPIRGKLATEFPGNPEIQDELLRTKNNLTIALKYQSREKESADLTNELLAEYRAMVAKFPNQLEFQIGLGRTLLNLSDFSIQNVPRAQAIACGKEGIEVYRALIQKQPQEPNHRSGKISHQVNLAWHLEQEGQHKDSFALHSSCIEELERMLVEYPSFHHFRQTMVVVLSRQARLNMQFNRSADAEQQLIRSIQICRGLIQRFPDEPAYLQRLTQALVIQARLQFHHLRQHSEAEKTLNELLEVSRTFLARFPNQMVVPTIFIEALAMGGDVFWNEGDLGKAEKLYREGCSVLEERIRLSPEFRYWKDENARFRANLAKIILESRPVEGLPLLKEAYQYKQQVFLGEGNKTTPHQYYLLSRTARNLAGALPKATSRKEAETLLSDSFSYAEKAMQADAGDSANRDEFLLSLGSWANGIQRKKGGDVEAINLVQKYLLAWESRSDEVAKSPDYRLDLERLRSQMAQTLLQGRQLDEATRHISQATKNLRALRKEYPERTDVLQKLVSFVQVEALRKSFSKPPTDSEKLYRESIELLQSGISAQPRNIQFREQLADAYSSLRQLYQEKFDPIQPLNAIICAQESLRLREELYREFPKRQSSIDQLGVAFGSLIDAQILDKRYTEAEGTFAREIRFYESLGTTALPKIARAFKRQGDMDLDREDLPRALSMWNKAIPLYDKLILEQPKSVALRHQLAEALTSVGDALSADFTSPSSVGVAEIERAIQLREEILRDFPQNTVQRGQIIPESGSLGRIQIYRYPRQFGKALAAYQKNLQYCKEQMTHFPDDPQTWVNLGFSWQFLGNLATIRNQPDEAQKAYSAGIDALESRLRDHPEESAVAAKLVELYFRRGFDLLKLIPKKEQFEASVRDGQTALKICEDFLKKNPASPEITAAMLSPLELLAISQSLLGSRKESLDAIDRAIAMSADLPKLLLQETHAGLLCRLGDPETGLKQGTDVHGKLVEMKVDDYNWPCLLSLYAEASSKNDKLSVEERKTRSEEYAAKAIAEIKSLAETGFFNDLSNVDTLKIDPDFAFLRSRDDFREIVKRLDSGPWKK